MIDFIVLSDLHSKEFSQRRSGKILGEFSHLNIFIGKNNNGKSRLMRVLFNDSNAVFLNLKNDKTNIEEIKQKFASNIAVLGNPFGNPHPIWKTLREDSQKVLIATKGKEGNNIFIRKLSSFYNVTKEKNPFEFVIPDGNIGNNLITQTQQIYESTYQLLIKQGLKRDESRFLYIPIMRGLRPLHSDDGEKFTNKDVYAHRTRIDYKINGPESKVYSGLTMYEDIKRLLLGTESERRLIADFQLFLEKQIFHEAVTLIPKYDGDVLHIKIGSSKQFEIYNLGDGLQTIISILFPIFIKRNQESLIFIEEPESHLHPEWQIKILQSLKEFKNHQFFISTHSTSFINDPEASVFSVSKIKNEIIIDKVDDDKKRLLVAELGYRPSDLLLANYILWVEGQSDKILIQKFLSKLAPELIEGQHFSIMLVGGENYKHLMSGKDDEIDLSLFKSLNSNFGIILDSDRTSSKGQIKLQKQKILDKFTETGGFCWITKKREIENYLPIGIFKEAVKKKHKKTNIEVLLGDYDDRNTIIDLDTKIASYKSTIKLPENFFSQVQKNKNGTTKGIDAKTLRQAIENAIQSTRKTTFTVNKIDVANEIASQEFEIVDEELLTNMQELITLIKKAN